jgi:hypothetical protein
MSTLPWGNVYLPFEYWGDIYFTVGNSLSFMTANIPIFPYGIHSPLAMLERRITYQNETVFISPSVTRLALVICTLRPSRQVKGSKGD